MSNNIIYARKCEIRPVDKNIAKDFVNNNHIDGHINAEFYQGLFYKNELIQVISCSNNKIGCLCTKSNIYINNGYKVISSIALNKNQIYTFNIDLSIDSINNYKGLNILKQCKKPPQPFYIYNNKRFFSYSDLVANLTDDNGYLEIYNAGYITLYIGEHNESCL